MVLLLASLLRFFLYAFSSSKTLLSENAVLKKENDILLRKVGKKRVHFSFYDRFFFVILNRAADVKDRLTLVKPDTVLAWQRTLIRKTIRKILQSFRRRGKIRRSLTWKKFLETQVQSFYAVDWQGSDSANSGGVRRLLQHSATTSGDPPADPETR
jgi:hypothetical protein